MGNQRMGRMAASNTQDPVLGQVKQLLSVLNSPTASGAQKAQAANQVVQLQKQNGAMSGSIQQLLQASGWAVKGDQLIYTATGEAQATGGFDDLSASTIDPGQYARSNWRQAATQLSQEQARRSGPNGQRGFQQTGGATYTGGNDPNSWMGEVDLRSGGAGALGATGQPDPGSVATTNPEYANAFFGNAQAGALNDLASNPGAAWQYYRARGGPDGGSLANSTASQYGQDDFKAAMALAPILAGSNGMLAPAQTLGFTNDWMKQATAGGGTYMDPTKILNAALSSAGSAPDVTSQQAIIGDAISAVEPYMDPTSYSMMVSRLNKVMDDYMAYGLENGTQDLSGVLLDMVYQALGM